MKLRSASFVSDEIDDRRRLPDRRDSPRRKILKGGRTFWPNGDSSECIVYNFSDTGAQLGFRQPVPNIFDLVIEGDPRRYSCSVVWRKANRLGVKFRKQHPPSSTNKPFRPFVDCKRYAQVCQELANRAAPGDSDVLLEMVQAWTKVMRQMRSKAANSF
jgi:hypothetical protein